MAKNRVTLKEIADATGFSSNTVSRALRNQAVISEDTRHIIQEKAAEIGYVPNRAASSLRSGQSHLVAFIVENLVNPFFGATFDYLDRAAGKYGYTVTVFSSHGTINGEIEAIRNAYSQNVDGILLITCDETGSSVRLMEKLKVPHLLLFRDIPSAKCSVVLQDELEGGKIAARYLLSRGCTSFVYVSPHWESYSMNERRTGFVAELKKNGIASDNMFLAVATEADAMAHTADVIVKEAFKQFKKCNRSSGSIGICVYCDSSSYGLMKQLADVADKIHFVSFDNIDDLILSVCPTTSVAADYVEMCRFAIESLDKAIQRQPVEESRKTFPVTIKLR